MKRVVLILVAATSLRCPTVQEGVLRQAENLPPVEASCTRDGMERCASGVPEVCLTARVGEGGRWYASLPRDANGTRRRCPEGCEMTDAGAHCRGAEAGTDGGAL